MHTLIQAFVISAIIVLSSVTGAVLAAEVEVLWVGHAAARITSTEGKVIVIDPFFKANPSVPGKYRDLAAIGKVDLILVTHGHGDHTADLAELAELSGAQVLASWEYALNLGAMDVIDDGRLIAMNKGGTISPLGPDIKIHMVPAQHSSSIDLQVMGGWTKESASPRFIEGGAPVGYVVELENGFTIYHAGDTDIFGDMALIGEFHEPDLALVPIGGHFTMGPEGAAYAVRELIKPKQVVPIHYGTYPIINRTPAEFKSALGETGVRVLDMKPGQAINF